MEQRDATWQDCVGFAVRKKNPRNDEEIKDEVDTTLMIRA